MYIQMYCLSFQVLYPVSGILNVRDEDHGTQDIYIYKSDLRQIGNGLAV